MLAGDSFDAAMTKIEEGIKCQTNQATARFKLFTKMPQRGLSFAEWYPRIKDQAERCIWNNYDAKQAARDAILFQTDSAKKAARDAILFQTDSAKLQKKVSGVG